MISVLKMQGVRWQFCIIIIIIVIIIIINIIITAITTNLLNRIIGKDCDRAYDVCCCIFVDWFCYGQRVITYMLAVTTIIAAKLTIFFLLSPNQSSLNRLEIPSYDQCTTQRPMDQPDLKNKL